MLVVRHPIEGLASDANQRVNLQVSELPQRGLACRQASELRKKSYVTLSEDFIGYLMID